jgi:hypothetical protein
LKETELASGRWTPTLYEREKLTTTWNKNLTGRHFKKTKMIAIEENPPTPAPREKVDTIIIGAGLSGLYAACLLTKEIKPFVVLEARDRVDGRILSPEYQDYYSDLGPSWYWPSSRKRVSKLNGLDITPSVWIDPRRLRCLK